MPAPAPSAALPAPVLPARAFYGQAAPATAAGDTTLAPHVRGGLEVFAQYAYSSTRAQDGARTWFHDFTVERAHAAVTAEVDGVTGRIVAEAVRSASEGALVGVAGDSLVLRVREAYVGYRPIDALEVRAGILPLLTIPELEGTWMLRAVAPVALETTKLAYPADVGISAKFSLPGGYGWVGVASFDGEGYASRELNRGKDVEIAASIHPAPDGAAKPFAVFASYVSGSEGALSARADRATGALLYQGDVLRAGASVTYAWGLEEQGARQSYLVDTFVRLEPMPRLLFGGRFWQWNRDTQHGDDVLRAIVATAGYRVARPLEAFVALTRSIPTTAAEASLPGTDYWQLAAVSRVVF